MHILVTSPRVAPGLMTYAAWEILRGADEIAAVDPDDPTVEAVRAAGFAVAVDRARVEDSPPGRVWLAPTGDASWAHDLASRLLEESGEAVLGETEVVFASYDLPGARLLDLVSVMDRLWRECPWTRLQTHESLRPYLLEETYEVLDTLERRDDEHLREELGDLLMQVAFHAAIAQDNDGWSIDDVAESIVEKLIYRNPHVFGDVVVSGPEEVEANWEALKATEKRRTSVLDGIPDSLPALAYAEKVVGRLVRGGVDVSADGTTIGDRLLGLVLEARAAGVDPEAALRAVVRSLLP